MPQGPSDELRRYLVAQGYTGSLHDMWAAALKAESGATSGAIGDLEAAFLAGQGYTQGALQDRWKQYFAGKGYTQSDLTAQWKAALAADDLFGAAAELLFYDTYTEATVTNMSAHTPDVDNIGSGWELNIPANINMRIKQSVGDSYLECNTSANFSYWAVVPNTASSYIAETTYETTTSVVGLIMTLRHIDANNKFWALSAKGAGNRIIIIERDTGVDTSRGQSGTKGSSETSVWVSDDGSTISAGFDRGAAGVTYSSTLHNTSKKVGHGGRGNTYWNNSFLLYGGTTDPNDLATP